MVLPDEPVLSLVETQGVGGAVEAADRRVEEIVTAHVIARADIAVRKMQAISADMQSSPWTPSAFEDLAASELRRVARTI